MKITENQIKNLGLQKSKDTYIEVFVEADVNDGDYISTTTRITSLQKYIKLCKIVEKIENYDGSHNWESRGEYLTPEEIDIFRDYMPYFDNEEVHSIDTISFTFVVDGVIYE